MLLRLMFVVVIYCAPLFAVPMLVYKNARFDPKDVGDQLTNIFSVTTQNACACHCYANSSCITSTFIGMNQTCTLFSVHLQQGQVRVMINSDASVMSFPNRTTDTNLNSPPLIIEWLFDGNFNDVYGHYNGNSVDNHGSEWISPGYAGYGSAVYFHSNQSSLVDYYLNLTTTSFTISAWILMPRNNTADGDYLFTLFGHCETTNTDKCLHIAIENSTLLLGFFSDDLHGNTLINLDQWNHVAYVYDRSISKQRIYLNGRFDGERTPDNPYTGNASQLTLGAVPKFTWDSFCNGYIDKLTFISRIKTDKELLDEATLVAYYPFDGTYLDSGPNKINNTSNLNTTFDSSGRSNQALVIGSASPSYFQTTGFYYLGQMNYSYSFSVWIYPFERTGTILQVSPPHGVCVPMIGFSSRELLTIQTVSSNGNYATSLFNETLPLNIWTHVGMTYSTINGIQLFVNGSLVNMTFTDYRASGEFYTVVVGTCPQSNTHSFDPTQSVLSQFHGKVDELKIFSRELSAAEIQQLALS